MKQHIANITPSGHLDEILAEVWEDGTDYLLQLKGTAQGYWYPTLSALIDDLKNIKEEPRLNPFHHAISICELRYCN